MTYIPDSLRQRVIDRAAQRCEYCLLHWDDAIKRHEIDHVVAVQHGGATTFDNLCLSCFVCNRYKGSNLTSIDQETGQIAQLYNPRKHRWSDHFELQGITIAPRTIAGKVTIFLLRMNDAERLQERALLVKLGRYPR